MSLNQSLFSKRMGFCFSHLTSYALRLRIEGLRYFYPPKPWRRQALPVLHSPGSRDAGVCSCIWIKVIRDISHLHENRGNAYLLPLREEKVP
jgi:hypothetical protein